MYLKIQRNFQKKLDEDKNFHEKKLVVNAIQLQKKESVVRFHDKHFPSICDHTRNLLSSFDVLKGF